MIAHEITLTDVTNYALLGQSSHEEQNLGSINYDGEYSLPRVGECLQIQLGEDEWSTHYTIVDIVWSVVPDKKTEGYIDEKFKRSDWKSMYPANIAVKNCNCVYTGDAGGVNEINSLVFDDDVVVVEATDVREQKALGD